MQINSVKATKTSSSKKSSNSSSSGAFAAELRGHMEGAGTSNSVSASVGVTDVTAIIAAQSISEDEIKQSRKRAFNRANDLLDGLDEIRDSLLFGSISKDRLINIAKSVRERTENCKDEKLQEILDEIELRVEVELAKLTK